VFRLRLAFPVANGDRTERRVGLSWLHNFIIN
jgi:hypothetical protein